VQEAQANSNDHLQKHVTILILESDKHGEDGNVNMKKLNKVAKALGKASKLHKKQSKIIKKHIKEMKRGTRTSTK
jgi:hypothetical protein